MNFMAIQKDRQFQMRVSDDWLRQLDEWRRKQPDLPPRAEAVRRLVQKGLDTEPRLVTVQVTRDPA